MKIKDLHVQTGKTDIREAIVFVRLVYRADDGSEPSLLLPAIRLDEGVCAADLVVIVDGAVLKTFVDDHVCKDVE